MALRNTTRSLRVLTDKTICAIMNSREDNVVIKIVNQTEYRTRDIRRFVTRCAKIAFRTKAERDEYGNCAIYIRYGSKRTDGYVGGYAYYHGGPAYIFLRKDNPDPIDRVCLAHTIAHELGHVKGLKHGDMSGLVRYDYAPGWREFYKWAEDLPCEKRPEPQAPPEPDPIVQREQKIVRYLTKIDDWKKKRSFADTKIKTYKRKVRALRAAQTRAAKN